MHLVLSPLLAARGALRAKKRLYRAVMWQRLAGGRRLSPKPRILVVSTYLGETRIAAETVRQLEQAGQGPVGMAISTDEAYEQAVRDGYRATVAPFNNPLSVALQLWRNKPEQLWLTNECDPWHLPFLAKAFGTATCLYNVNLSPEEADRMAQKKLATWRWRSFDRIFAQSEPAADRLKNLGVAAEAIIPAGPILSKPMRSPEEIAEIRARWRSLLQLSQDQPLVVAGSTRWENDEEALVLQAFKGFKGEHHRAHLLLAPRHPDRKVGLTKFANDAGLKYRLRSQLPGDEAASVTILDTMGELAEAYGAADLAFVGASFVPHLGGHTPVEPLSFAVPVVMGPHYHQHEALVVPMKKADLAFIADTPEQLAATWSAALKQPAGHEKASELMAQYRQTVQRMAEEMNGAANGT